MLRPKIDSDAMLEYMVQYVSDNFNSPKVSRMLERVEISTQFNKWDYWVRKKHFNRPVFIFKDDDYNHHYDTPIAFINIYSSNIYPHYVVSDKGQAIIWDSHYWDLFGFFIMCISDIIFYKNKYNNEWGFRKETDFAKTKRVLNSLMLLFLTHKKENDPVLSYLIAEMYSKKYSSIPDYSHTFALPNNTKEYCNPEEYLSDIGLLWVSDFAKQFVFLHECTHVKMRTQPSEKRIECENIVNICKSFKFDKKVDEFINSEICSAKNTNFAEEIFYDFNSINLIKESSAEESFNVDKAMLAVNYLQLFQCWLKITDVQWKILTEVSKTTLTKERLHKISTSLEKEYMFANTRQGIVRAMANYESLDWGWFANNFLTNDDCYGMIDEIMDRYREINKESKSAIEWRNERNSLIGWDDDDSSEFATKWDGSPK